MKVQEVILRALSGRQSWLQGPTCWGVSPRTVRRLRLRYHPWWATAACWISAGAGRRLGRCRSGGPAGSAALPGAPWSPGWSPRLQSRSATTAFACPTASSSQALQGAALGPKGARAAGIGGAASRGPASASCWTWTAVAIAGWPSCPTRCTPSSPWWMTPPSGCSTRICSKAARAWTPYSRLCGRSSRRMAFPARSTPIAPTAPCTRRLRHRPGSHPGDPGRSDPGAPGRRAHPRLLAPGPGAQRATNGTLQGRLVNELRVAGVTTLAAANRYLRERFLPEYSATFSRVPADPASAFVPVGEHDPRTDPLSRGRMRRPAGQPRHVWPPRAADHQAPGPAQLRRPARARPSASRWAPFHLVGAALSRSLQRPGPAPGPQGRLIPTAKSGRIMCQTRAVESLVNDMVSSAPTPAC